MKLFNFKKKKGTSNENWELYESYDEDENLAIISFDRTYEDQANQKGFREEVLIQIEIPEHRLANGIPVPEEQQHLNQVEDQFCSLLEKNNVNCKQVLHITFLGCKQFIFECNSLKAFEIQFNLWKETLESGYECSISIGQAFAYYREMLPDQYGKQQIVNRKVVENLLKSGAKPNKEHFIEHAIFGKPENLKKALAELQEQEIQLISLKHDHLEVGANALLEEEEISNQTDYIISIAKKHGCTYNGWQTKPQN